MKDKNIIQIHRSYKALSLYEKVSVERWQRFNPEYTYYFLNHDEADQHVYDLFPEWKEHYESLPLGSQSNIRRAAILFNIGGIYVDCDLCPVVPLSEYIPEKSEVVLFSHPIRNMYMNACFASDKGQELMKQLAFEGLRRTFDLEQPSDQKSDDWLSWHFHTTGVLCCQDVFGASPYRMEDAISGLHYHHHDVADGNAPSDMKAMHFGTGLWMPRRSAVKPQDMYNEQNINLNALHEMFGPTGRKL